MAESGLGDSLTKEVGGVPVWVIGAGVGGVIAVGAYFMNRTSGGGTQTVYSSDDLQPEDSDPTNNDVGLPNGPIGDWLGQNPGYPGYPVGGPVNGLPSPITNGQWGRFVMDQLLAKGDDPSLVSSAITKYLSGAGLSAAEAAIVRLALQLFGTPPEGALEIKPITTPVNPSPTFGTPSGLKAASVGKVSVFLTWKAVPGALAYTVTRGPSGQAAKKTVPLVPSFLWTSLKPDTQYTFSVYARGPGGASTKSNVIDVRTHKP